MYGSFGSIQAESAADGRREKSDSERNSDQSRYIGDNVGMMMNGTRNPTLRTAVNVAHALGVTLTEMLEGAEYE